MLFWLVFAWVVLGVLAVRVLMLIYRRPDRAEPNDEDERTATAPPDDSTLDSS